MRRPGDPPTIEAVLDAADELELPEDILARVLRCSAETIRLYREGKSLVRAEVHLDAAAELLEVSRLIRSRVGFRGSPAEWLRAYQGEIGRIPLELLKHDWGISDLLDRLRDHTPIPRVPPASVPAEPASIPAPVASPAPAAQPQPRPQPKRSPWQALAAFARKVAAGAASFLRRIRRWIRARG